MSCVRTGKCRCYPLVDGSQDDAKKEPESTEGSEVRNIIHRSKHTDQPYRQLTLKAGENRIGIELANLMPDTYDETGIQGRISLFIDQRDHLSPNDYVLERLGKEAGEQCGKRGNPMEPDES